MEWLGSVRRFARRGSLARPGMRHPVAPALCASILSLLLLSVSLANVLAIPQAQAAPSWGLPASASCAALAQLDHTATNGAEWGQTIFPGHNARNGWFGVDVCGNGINASAPNGANVSCDRVPDNWPKTGCAPGNATSDGYGLTFQCVELIIRFSAWAFGDSVSGWGRSGYGNAPDLWLAVNHPQDWVMYPNGSNHAPVPGDILVWGDVNAQGQPWPAGPDGEHGGHIGIVAAVHDGIVMTAEQNVKWGTDDHPSDTLALTKVGGRWILSGSNRPETTLPTYRWRSTMGTSRATYGWLHNINNKGTFPAKGVHSTTHAAATPTPTKAPKPTVTPPAPAQQSGGLPSLADSAVVTADGILTDLSWSTSDLFATATTNPQSPSAHVRSLGAPPGTHLVANQSVSTVVLPDGTRYCYAVGADGHLYSVRTAPDVFGVQWSDLGTPNGVQLQPVTAASTYAGGLGVVVLGADGNLWWRGGPVSSPGGWLLAGRPPTTPLSGSFTFAGQPGSGSPLLLALGQDGRVYERVWQPSLFNSDGSIQVPAGWSDWLSLHAQLPAVHLTSKLLLVPETVNARSWQGAWPDTPIDLLGADALGNLWWLRSTGVSSGWKLSPVRAPHAVTSLLAAVVVAHASESGKSAQPTSGLHLYAATVAGPYIVSIALPSDAPASADTHSATDGNGQPGWTPLAPMPQGLTSAAAGAALDLGTDSSALVVAKGDGVLVGGIANATSTLLATDTLTVSKPSGADNPWLDVGGISGAAAFADALNSTAVDGRWYLAGVGADAAPSAHGLRLAAGNAGAAALLQSANSGDGSVQVQITLPPASRADAAGGLVLYLDGSDWLTLLVNGSGRLSFCATANQTMAPCQVTTIKRLPTKRTLWLRVTRASGHFTGEYSTDNRTWNTIGNWSAPAASANGATNSTTGTAQSSMSVTPGTPSPAPIATRTATPTSTAAATATPTPAPWNTPEGLAPLAFTEWGLYVAGDAKTSSWPVFESFTVSATASGQ